ncbi:MAG: type II secretion system protein M [Gammaproteobacteria bacterium]|nr:type II secretion system protein M [Gammaproteobacteria bacterium]
MKDWWNNLQSREQSFVLIAGIALILFLFYSLAWSPLADARDKKLMRVENNQELLLWMKSKSTEIKQLKLTNPNLLKSDNKRSLLAIVDSLANRLGLRAAIRQIQPDGPHAATVYMDEINFDALATMLGQLDKNSNVKVREASITKLEKPGLVKARLILKRL